MTTEKEVEVNGTFAPDPLHEALWSLTQWDQGSWWVGSLGEAAGKFTLLHNTQESLDALNGRLAELLAALGVAKQELIGHFVVTERLEGVARVVYVDTYATEHDADEAFDKKVRNREEGGLVTELALTKPQPPLNGAQIIAMLRLEDGVWSVAVAFKGKFVAFVTDDLAAPGWHGGTYFDAPDDAVDYAFRVAGYGPPLRSAA